MILRGVDFGLVLNASGDRGFAGEGYWFHGPWKHLGLDYTGSTFVAKTTTLKARAGNMPLDSRGLRPVQLLPRCIVVKPFQGAVLNSVGLSGPGATAVLREVGASMSDGTVGRTVMVSFMSVAPTAEERLDETRRFVRVFQASEVTRRGNLAIQANFSCPNAGLDPSALVGEVRSCLAALGRAGVPVLAKVNALFPAEAIWEMQDHPDCDGMVVSNTIPWGKLRGEIDWRGLFGSDVSPLADLGGGGLSGAPILPVVERAIRRARRHGFLKPIVGGGGVLSKEDADVLLVAGADAIEVGSVSILRPWRVRGIIEHVNGRKR